MNNDLSEALKALKDIHQPDAITLWPLPLGWWLALLLIIGLSSFMGYWYKRRNPRYKKVAYKELKQFYITYQTNQDSTQFVQAISGLIRRVALVTYLPEQVANLTGDAWLNFLDTTGKTTVFSEGLGQSLSTAPYRASAEVNVEGLLEMTKKWIGAIK